MEWECFWVNLREYNKVSESKMAVSDSNLAEFKIAAIFKFIQNEWIKSDWISLSQSQNGVSLFLSESERR